MAEKTHSIDELLKIVHAAKEAEKKSAEVNKKAAEPKKKEAAKKGE